MDSQDNKKANPKTDEMYDGPMPHNDYIRLTTDKFSNDRPYLQLRTDIEQMQSKLTLGQRLRVAKMLMELSERLLMEHPRCQAETISDISCGYPAAFQVDKDKYACQSHVGRLIEELSPSSVTVRPILHAH